MHDEMVDFPKFSHIYQCSNSILLTLYSASTEGQWRGNHQCELFFEYNLTQFAIIVHLLKADPMRSCYKN